MSIKGKTPERHGFWWPHRHTERWLSCCAWGKERYLEKEGQRREERWWEGKGKKGRTQWDRSKWVSQQWRVPSLRWVARTLNFWCSSECCLCYVDALSFHCFLYTFRDMCHSYKSFEQAGFGQTWRKSWVLYLDWCGVRLKAWVGGPSNYTESW